MDFDWLDDEHLFCVYADPSSIKFVNTPERFFETLKEKVRSSQQRILIASLYLGTGEKERQLVDLITSRLQENENLQVGLLFDYFRGTRVENEQSTAKMLLPIASKAGVYFYHTPQMDGLKRTLLPGRLSESVGLQHIKFFVFDDSIMISGANLSDIYFTNRQDRCLLIENTPMLADFFADLFSVLSDASLRMVNSDGRTNYSSEFNLIGHSFFAQKINILFTKYRDLARDQNNQRNKNTFIIPFLQIGPYGINQEFQVLRWLISGAEENTYFMATGYFNLSDKYMDLLSHKSFTNEFRILAASPEANGFFNAIGLAGYVPTVYLQSAFEFLTRFQERSNFKLMEWKRPNWTFHAKGLWVESPKHNRIATIIGSSNYGYRSTYRDLEAQVVIVTDDHDLKNRINEEKNYLLQFASPVNLSVFIRRDYTIPAWMKYFYRFFRSYF